jgi:hypothetical protein
MILIGPQVAPRKQGENKQMPVAEIPIATGFSLFLYFVTKPFSFGPPNFVLAPLRGPRIWNSDW